MKFIDIFWRSDKKIPIDFKSIKENTIIIEDENKVTWIRVNMDLKKYALIEWYDENDVMSVEFAMLRIWKFLPKPPQNKQELMYTQQSISFSSGEIRSLGKKRKKNFMEKEKDEESGSGSLNVSFNNLHISPPEEEKNDMENFLTRFNENLKRERSEKFTQFNNNLTKKMLVKRERKVLRTKKKSSLVSRLYSNKKN